MPGDLRARPQLSGLADRGGAAPLTRRDPVGSPPTPATAGREHARARRRALPDLPQHHRRRRAADARDGLASALPLDVHEVPTGTPVFDWTVPAGVEHPRRLRSRTRRASGSSTSARSNLHVVSYSVPVRRTAVARRAAAAPAHAARPARLDPVPHLLLRRGLGLLPAPTRSCDALPEGEYEVCIDSTLADGHLTYGECSLPGDSRATRC